jgi:hypothetical protein
LSQHIASALRDSVLRNELPRFDDYFQPIPIDVEQTETGRISDKLGLWHLASALVGVAWKEGSIKEANVRWIFDNLPRYFRLILGRRESHKLWVLLPFRSCSGGHTCCSGDSWSSHIIVHVESEKRKYRYTPQSDFHVALDQLIYLLVEVQSDTNERDKYRMLLHAACVARLGRALYNHPFIVVALYIKNDGKVKQYFVFQRDSSDREVCTFESRWSCFLFPVLPGFLCRGLARLE